jgi:hypothetical protein
MNGRVRDATSQYQRPWQTAEIRMVRLLADTCLAGKSALGSVRVNHSAHVGSQAGIAVLVPMQRRYLALDRQRRPGPHSHDRSLFPSKASP